MRNELFLIVIYHSSLVKGAMNAARQCCGTGTGTGTVGTVTFLLVEPEPEPEP